MKNTAHTPAPWRTNIKADGRHHQIPILAPWECHEGEDYHPLIASVFHGQGHTPRAVAEANAQLISAAPALLAALECWVTRHDFWSNGQPDEAYDPEVRDNLLAARAAIAQATR